MMAKTLRSRIWTSSLDMEAEHINFTESIYEHYYAQKHNTTVKALKKEDVKLSFDDVKKSFDETELGAHYEESNGEQDFLIDPAKYISYISWTLHGYDERCLVYGIVHDRDIRYDENGDPVYREGKQVLDMIPKHLHILIRFSKAVGVNVVSSLTGIIQTELDKGHTRGRYAFSSAMAYLTHRLHPKKHQYDPHDVINGRYNADLNNESGLYLDFYKAHHDEWSRRLATVEKKQRQLDFDKIYEDTMLGKYTHDDLIGGDDDLYKLYVEHKRQLDDARAAYLDRRFIKYSQAVRAGRIKIQTLYIFGQAGRGKTRLARRIAEGLKSLSRNWRVFQGGSKNTFDQYDGEEVIILDDLRVNAMNASDWLHLLDPYNVGTTSARYHDATPMPRLLMITTTEPAHEFFAYTKGSSESEPLDQFLRRIQMSANVVDMDHVNIGKNKKLSAPRELQLEDKISSWSTTEDFNNPDDVSSTKHVNYKAAPKKKYQYAYEDWYTGDFDTVATTLINYYASYFGLQDTSTPKVMEPEHHEATGSALPVISDGPKMALDDPKSSAKMSVDDQIKDVFGDDDPENK